MNRWIVYSLLFMVFSVTGCTMRAETYKRDRVDQELKGNRGYIMGTVPSLPEKARKTTRTMYNVEIELPTAADFESHRQEEKEEIPYTEPGNKPGNKGYLEKKSEVTCSTLKVAKKPAVVVYPRKEQWEKETAEEIEKIYVVQKGDTLQKISDKMYGTTKRWKKIFEANKNLLKSPDKIKPGQKLVIPMN